MLRRLMFLCCLLGLILANAAYSVAQDRGSRYVITMKPLGQQPDTLAHLSEWQASLRGTSIVLHWSCKAFQLMDAEKAHCDALMTLDVLSARGQINVSPTRDSDQTNCELNDDEANVSTSMSGVGATTMRLQIELTSPFPAAGEYLTTVELSVTAN